MTSSNKPDMNLAIFVGPAKTGTTWLFEYAKNHKELSTSIKDKEIQYFNKYYTRGIDWYEAYFANNQLLKCDFSPSYFSSDLGRVRIKKDFPNAKIIITLRNPIERTLSHYKHFHKLGLINESDARLALSKNTTFVSNSFYSRHLPEWIKTFGKENVLILPIEGMKENLDNYLNQLCTFLNIDPVAIGALAVKKINEQSVPKNRAIAFMASRLRRYTKNKELRWITEAAKKIGLKKMIYSGGTQEILISDEVFAELEELFQPEIESLEQYIAKDIYKKYYNND